MSPLLYLKQYVPYFIDSKGDKFVRTLHADTYSKRIVE